MIARRRRQRRTGWIALIMYLGVAVVLPLVHAEDEVLWSQPSYEAHHTSGCRVIHSEAGCPTHQHLTRPEPASGRLSIPAAEVRIAIPAADRPVGGRYVLVLRSRAPPLS